MANHALDLNPPNAAIHISTHGSDWLWAAFSVITLVLLVVIGLDFMVSFTMPLHLECEAHLPRQRPRGTRLFHQLAIIILTTTSLAYFSMASDLGATPISTEFRGDGETRQIWVSSIDKLSNNK